jgi:hypothetical protein
MNFISFATLRSGSMSTPLDIFSIPAPWYTDPRDPGGGGGGEKSCFAFDTAAAIAD